MVSQSMLTRGTGQHRAGGRSQRLLQCTEQCGTSVRQARTCCCCAAFAARWASCFARRSAFDICDCDLAPCCGLHSRTAASAPQRSLAQLTARSAVGKPSAPGRLNQ